MKNIICIALMSLVILVGKASAEISPDEMLSAALWHNNCEIAEIEISEIISSNWTEKKTSTIWVIRNYPETQLMFVLNRGHELDKNPDGAIITTKKGEIVPPVMLQKRGRIKMKSSGFDDKANGTELNYFVLSGLGGEYVSDLQLEDWPGAADVRIKEKTTRSIKATPKNHQPGNYSFRVFHVGIAFEMPVVVGVECYGNDGKPLMIQINSDFELIKTEKFAMARERNRRFITKEGETTIQVIERKLDGRFGELDQQALEQGKPR